MNHRPIGIFDSGVGGLTVLSEISRILPRERLIYFGDTARFPYGPKSKKTIVRYARQISRFLLRFDVKMIVIACNTASSLALDSLRRELSIPVIGVIEPVLRILPSPKNDNARIGVIGTRSTIRSGAYQRLIRRLYPGYTVFARACPLFVTLVEEGWADKRIASIVAHEYLDELVRERIDSLILGCTHYPLLKNMLHREFPGIELYDGSAATASYIAEYLKHQDALSGQATGSVDIYISDITDYFDTLERLFFGHAIASIRDIRLDEMAGETGEAYE